MTFKARLHEPDWQAEARGASRRRLNFAATGSLASGASAEVVVHNASTTGLLLESPVNLGEGDEIELDLPEAGAVIARVVWASDDFYGCRFDRPVPAAALSAAQLLSGADGAAAVPGSASRETLHARLQRLRYERRMTLSDVAGALGLSKPTVWAWEKGKARPADHRLPAIAALYGIELEDLLAAAPATGLDSIVDAARRDIAAAFGTVPAKVRVMIEL
jgi:DNA-binding XRE family transcriptional regulator